MNVYSSVYAVGRTVTKCFLKLKALSGGRLMLVFICHKYSLISICLIITIPCLELLECYFLLISDVSSA